MKNKENEKAVLKSVGAEEKGKKVYEWHDMTQLPVIFHEDYVIAGCGTSNWHENVEILLFKKGEGRVICDGEAVEVRAGDICVIDSGVLHRVEGDADCRYFCLIVDGDFCRRQGLPLENVRFERRICDPILREEYNKVAEAVAAKDGYRVPAIKGAVLSFMVHLLREYGRTEEVHSSRSDAGIRTAIGWIRAHFDQPLTVDGLAAVAGLSKYHFLREFKRVTSLTVVNYINTVRIEQAVRLLGEGELSVSAVGTACGFGNHSYFSKIFHRQRGVLPSEFLEQEAAKRKNT